MGEEPFCLGNILFKSWQITTQLKMAAWRDIFTHNRSIKGRNTLIQRFQETCFGSYDGHDISWNLFPHIIFLAQDIASNN